MQSRNGAPDNNAQHSSGHTLRLLVSIIATAIIVGVLAYPVVTTMPAQPALAQRRGDEHRGSVSTAPDRAVSTDGNPQNLAGLKEFWLEQYGPPAINSPQKSDGLKEWWMERYGQLDTLSPENLEALKKWWLEQYGPPKTK